MDVLFKKANLTERFWYWTDCEDAPDSDNAKESMRLSIKYPNLKDSKYKFLRE